MTTRSMIKTAAAILALSIASLGTAVHAQSSTSTTDAKPNEGVVEKTKKTAKKAADGTKKVAHKASDATKRGANKAAGAVRNTGEKIENKLPPAPPGANSNLNDKGQPKTAP